MTMYTKEIISTTNTQDDLALSRESGPISRDKSIISLSNISCDCKFLLSEKEIRKIFKLRD